MSLFERVFVSPTVRSAQRKLTHIHFLREVLSAVVCFWFAVPKILWLPVQVFDVRVEPAHGIEPNGRVAEGALSVQSEDAQREFRAERDVDGSV